MLLLLIFSIALFENKSIKLTELKTEYVKNKKKYNATCMWGSK